MRSTYFADNKSKEEIQSTDDAEAQEVDTRGFLGFAVVMFVIYAATSRPALYAAVGKWISQLFG